MWAADASTVPSSRPVEASTTWTGRPPPPRMSVRSAARSRRVQNHPLLRRRSSPRLLQLRHELRARRAEQLQVGLGERELGRRRAQMGGQDVGVVRVEHGGLDGLLEQRLGVVDEVGVQRVVAGDQDGERALARAAGPARLLPQRGPGARVARDQYGVEAGDVDAEFQGGGGGQAEELAGVQGLLEGAALLGQVAAPVGGDAPGEGAVDLVQALLGDDGDEFGAAPGADEGDRADPLHGQVGEEVGGLGDGGAAHRRALLAGQLGERGLPQGEDQLAARRGVVGDLDDGQAGQAARGEGGLGGRGRGEQEDRVGAVAGAQAAQTAQDLGDVGAEDAAVGVALVDDDIAQGAQEGGPPGVGGQDAQVQHVRIGEDVVGVLAHPLAFLDRSVAVVHGGPDRVAQRGREGLHRAALVGGQGLGRGEVEGGRAAAVRSLGAVQEGAEDRRQVGQRLAGRGAGGDHHRFAVQGVLGGGGLVGPGVLDAGVLDGVDHFRADQVRPHCMTPRARGQVLRMSDARSPARPCGEPVEDRAGVGSFTRAVGGCSGAVIPGHRHRVCHWRSGQWSQGVVHGCW